MLFRSSGVSAVVDATAVPVDPHVTLLTRSRGGDGLGLALHGGEDYQLLFAVPPEHLAELRALAGIWDMTISVLGHFEQGPGAVMLKSPGELKPLLAASHDHFRTMASAGEGGT